MQTQLIAYSDGTLDLEGYVALPKTRGPCPGVLVAPTWAGRDDFACGRADALADLGYVGMAIDLYGAGYVGSGPEENARLMQPFLKDRAMLRRRLGAALRALCELDAVDADRVGAIGYCFGGLCVLDLARSGAPARGVVAFHGLLSGAEGLPSRAIAAKILALHGYDDPFAPPEQLLGFCREMTGAGADWQVHVYGGTMHAFTNPSANDPVMGTVYDENADRRSWRAMESFLEEVMA